MSLLSRFELKDNTSRDAYHTLSVGLHSLSETRDDWSLSKVSSCGGAILGAGGLRSCRSRPLCRGRVQTWIS